MITYIKGDIFDSPAQALVNTVNTVGVMGKGVALQFKKLFPENFKSYKKACANGEIHIGKLWVTEDSNLHTGEKIIINFPTKKHWRNPSEYQYIEKGLDDLIQIIKDRQIESIAIPPLGAGNGGLKWERVKTIIERKLENIKCHITLYEPNGQIKEILKKERVKLTPARALLLYVLYDLVKNGEMVSEFACEKIAYFLQRFGAKKYFKLDFQPYFYGPYSGKVRFLINTLNGSYIRGFSDMDKRPFAPLVIEADGYDAVKKYIESNPDLYEIAQRTIHFLDGFYSDFALEMLSTVDYISWTAKTDNRKEIAHKMTEWSSRKEKMLNNTKYLDISLNHLQKTSFA